MKKGLKLSEETKKLLSQKRKQFLRDNPDKHPWKSKNKFKSEPCENFKNILRENNYKFLEEFTPTFEHNYSIDIVFPEKMIGIEINGNQHYERNGKLKKYYQDRHDHIEASGWKLYEIHYSLCFDISYILNLVNQICVSEDKIEFNYEEYVQKKLEKKNPYDLCACGQKKCKTAKLCDPCQRIKRRKVSRPAKDQLHYMIWNDSVLQISKQINVSDNAIKNWCIIYKLNKPPTGYWEKIKHGHLTDYQI
jgi:very-short-patch-repair endonuclease